MRRVLPIIILAGPAIGDRGQIRPAMHDFEVAPQQERIAGGPSVRQIQCVAGNQRFKTLIGREATHPFKSRQITMQVREFALVVMPDVQK